MIERIHDEPFSPHNNDWAHPIDLRKLDDSSVQDLCIRTRRLADKRPSDRIPCSVPKRARRQLHANATRSRRVLEPAPGRRHQPDVQLYNAENGVGSGPASQARLRTLHRAWLLSPAGGMRAGALMAFWIAAELSAH